MDGGGVLEEILTAEGSLRITSDQGDEALVRVVDQADPWDVQAVNVEVVEGDAPGDDDRAQIRSEQHEDASWSRPVAYWVGHADEDLKWRIVEAEGVS